jgi:hypothetical protein
MANLNATNIFQGLLGCLPANFGYLPNEQRFNAFLPDSIFVNENYLSAGLPLSILPFGFPTGKRFEFAYSQQASFGIEMDLGHDFAGGCEPSRIQCIDYQLAGRHVRPRIIGSAKGKLFDQSSAGRSVRH